MISDCNFRPLFFCHRPSHVAYLRINKNACSSLARFVAELHGPVKDPLWDESNFDLVTKDWQEVNGLFTFTFVRNPYRRFHSFYKNWIVDPPHEKVLEHYRPMGLYKNMPLQECIRKVVKIKKKKLEAHLRPQHEFVFYGNRLNVKFIGKVEEMDKDMPLIQRMAGVEGDLAHSNKTNASELSFPEKEKSQLFRYYQQDFEIFNYDPKVS